jgi:hypothetical protein
MAPKKKSVMQKVKKVFSCDLPFTIITRSLGQKAYLETWENDQITLSFPQNNFKVVKKCLEDAHKNSKKISSSLSKEEIEEIVGSRGEVFSIVDRYMYQTFWIFSKVNIDTLCASIPQFSIVDDTTVINQRMTEKAREKKLILHVDKKHKLNLSSET